MKLFHRKNVTVAIQMLMTSLLVMTGTNIRAQSQERNYSTLILNFSKGIEWPGSKQDDKFVIGVYEYQPLVAELENMVASFKAGNKKITVRALTAADESVSCNVLFVPAYKAKALPALLDKIGNTATLIITNKTDMAKKGSGVNFVLVNGRLQYEINCRSIERRGMKIPANIKGMGIIVEN